MGASCFCKSPAYTALTIPVDLKIELEEKQKEVEELEARLRDA